MPFSTRSPVTRSVAAPVARWPGCSAPARPGRPADGPAAGTRPARPGPRSARPAASTGEAENSTALPATSAARALAISAYAVTIRPVRSASELASPTSSPGRPGAPPAGSRTRAATPDPNVAPGPQPGPVHQPVADGPAAGQHHEDPDHHREPQPERRPVPGTDRPVQGHADHHRHGGLGQLVPDGQQGRADDVAPLTAYGRAQHARGAAHRWREVWSNVNHPGSA